MKNIKYLIYLFLGLVIFSCTETEDENPTNRPEQEDILAIDNRVQDIMQEFLFPGLSIAIAENGRLVYTKAYGLSDVNTGSQVNINSEFRYSSFAKTITGIAIMQLVEKGKLALDDRVFGEGAILGTEFGNNAYSNRIRNITVNHLLHHLSGGWRNFVDDPVFDSPFNLSQNEMISWGLDNVAQATNPGTTYHYSNFGYVLLGRVIEKASGMSYDAYVKSEILDPVGAKNTYLANTSANDKGPNEVSYLADDSLSPYTTYNIGRADATAGWVSTPSDVVRILSAVDQQPNHPALLSTQSNQLRRTPLNNSGNYGKGVYRLAHPDLGNVYWHDGSWPGTQTLSISIPGNIAISVAMNSSYLDNYQQSLNFIAGKLFEIVQDESITFQDIDQF
ncbi:beta-lactamase [Indibacter alkaliphilus LW1]|uniref:Beta-lactamase n=1 Tax=Indibacter alkaliphilus (strain CCUG 57479 / KCTC 22604 / LW1) TaxID=1189612 RepID=S2DG74_INDAL|nr:serine hydrolase domain-containing protein [Indibacter alkaliphilus]EOZ96055.1 beta-lactamase [Indibacter alkaliphilus LW1]